MKRDTEKRVVVRMAETAKVPHVAFITEIRVIGDDGSFAHTLAPPVKITDKDQFSLVIRDGIPMGVTVKRRRIAKQSRAKRRGK